MDPHCIADSPATGIVFAYSNRRHRVDSKSNVFTREKVRDELTLLTHVYGLSLLPFPSALNFPLTYGVTMHVFSGVVYVPKKELPAAKRVCV